MRITDSARIVIKNVAIKRNRVEVKKKKGTKEMIFLRLIGFELRKSILSRWVVVFPVALAVPKFSDRVYVLDEEGTIWMLDKKELLWG